MAEKLKILITKIFQSLKLVAVCRVSQLHHEITTVEPRAHSTGGEVEDKQAMKFNIRMNVGDGVVS